ncbi:MULTISPECIES: PP2C family protein-serine/threonine phosphatase [Bradyrhizobium]|uniref:PP2C family protein-serine/threonine phosphatase n=1 Tax=Bradyrhizobium TaxID=374 RepID=UPI0010B2102F|nr:MULTISPECIES: protein phosphatase 2C domain-containing protein [Bradyrhizobium]QOZ27454.1 serine/threonine-protein phosphatase [Bradyrhizobium sp. CCBAU 51753]VIO78095.1 PP2C-family Ser/Thr phosphatase [Bradyrhizobium ivorense]
MNEPLFTFDAGSATHVGKVRVRNEDSHLVRSDAGLWAVADGMGGHEAGNVASELVVAALDTVSTSKSAAEFLEQVQSRVLLANRQILELRRQRGGIVIGSTVTVLLISENHYACLWAGDSRLYLASRGAIRQVSRDHTEIEELLASGGVTIDEARDWPTNVITRAVGVRDNPELEIVSGAFEACDIFVLCSDGLTRHVTDDEILECVSTRDAQASSTALVHLALERGGLDNVTVIVVRTTNQTPKQERTIPAAILQAPPAEVWE